MTQKAGTRLQVTIKPQQLTKLEALRVGSYLTTSQLIMMMIDTFYKRKFGDSNEHE